MDVEGCSEKSGASSTFANAFTLTWLMLETLERLAERGQHAPVWRSGNAPGGDEANRRFIARFKGRVRCL